jgi:hypothetical protein
MVQQRHMGGVVHDLCLSRLRQRQDSYSGSSCTESARVELTKPRLKKVGGLARSGRVFIKSSWRRQLNPTGNPNDKGQLLMPVASRDFPTAKRRKVNAHHHKWLVRVYPAIASTVSRKAQGRSI